MRGKRGLNHVHVGSLHAADAEMALHHARDLYTRRNEGVSIWVVRADDITASSPAEKDPFFAPGGRQGLPAPDLLRDPGRGAAPVTVESSGTTPRSTSTTPPTPTSRCPRPPRTTTRAGRSAPGFEDASAEITAPVPDGVDPADLAAYCLMLGDDALIYSHRLSEWVTNAPELEEEVALANIALDLLGQARVLLARAGHVEGAAATRTRWPTCATEPEFRNVALAEPADDLDFAPLHRAAARVLDAGGWRCCSGCAGSADPVVAAVADKGVKELTYHRDYAARWTVRLGDGTTESHRRMQAALDGSGPSSTSCSAPPRGTPARRGRGRPSTRRAPATSSTRCSPRSSARPR